jgi:hypothetical protein
VRTRHQALGMTCLKENGKRQWIDQLALVEPMIIIGQLKTVMCRVLCGK